MEKRCVIRKKVKHLLENNNYTTKIKIYFSSKSYGDDYDPYEDNATYSNLSPLILKAYVREILPETAFYKQYGLHKTDMKEVICEDKYKNWFEKCNRIVIDDVDYQVFKAGTGGKTMISKRPQNMLRVVLTRKD
jgi:hypothetical protein